MNNCFFDESNKALDNLTTMYDTIWPIAVSLWRMRCEIQGFMSENPDFKNTDFSKIYSVGSKITGVNYQRAFVEKTWSQQKKELSLILLSEAISLFEGWADDLVKHNFSLTKRDGSTDEEGNKNRIKSLQFHINVVNEVNSMNSSQSTFMTANIYPQSVILKRRNFRLIYNLLLCYRVFKEIRNAYVHNGSKTTQRLIDTYNEYTRTFSCPSDLGTSVLPSLSIGTIDSKLELDLRDAVFATEIIMIIIISIDAELTKSSVAENILIDRIKNSEWYNKKLNTNKEKRNKQIKDIFTNIGLVPAPSDYDTCYTFLRNNGLIRF